jgi:predicted PurR-regulated permease PerM
MPDWLPWLVVATPVAVLLTRITINFVTAITGVLTLILFAEFVALALEPGVNWLARRGWRRGSATGLLMAAVLVLLVGSIALIVPTFVTQLLSLFERLPNIIVDLADKIGVDVSVENIQEAISNERETLAKIAGDLAGNVLTITASVLGVIGSIATVGLLAFYLTAEAPKVRRSVLSLFRRRQQEDLLRLWEISIDKVGGYLYSRALMGVLSGFLSYVLLRILGVPFAAPLSIFVGFVSQFVPVVGTYIAYAIPILIALASGGLSDAIVILVFALIYQQLENLLISPRLSARTMKLHPAVAFVAALIGGTIGGLVMAFLALPIAAIIQAFVSTFMTRHEVIASDLTSDRPTHVEPPEESRRSVVERVRERFGRSGKDKPAAPP